MYKKLVIILIPGLLASCAFSKGQILNGAHVVYGKFSNYVGTSPVDNISEPCARAQFQLFTHDQNLLADVSKEICGKEANFLVVLSPLQRECLDPARMTAKPDLLSEECQGAVGKRERPSSPEPPPGPLLMSVKVIEEVGSYVLVWRAAFIVKYADLAHQVDVDMSQHQEVWVRPQGLGPPWDLQHLSERQGESSALSKNMDQLPNGPHDSIQHASARDHCWEHGGSTMGGASRSARLVEVGQKQHVSDLVDRYLHHIQAEGLTLTAILEVLGDMYIPLQKDWHRTCPNPQQLNHPEIKGRQKTPNVPLLLQDLSGLSSAPGTPVNTQSCSYSDLEYHMWVSSLMCAVLSLPLGICMLASLLSGMIRTQKCGPAQGHSNDWAKGDPDNHEVTHAQQPEHSKRSEAQWQQQQQRRHQSSNVKGPLPVIKEHNDVQRDDHGHWQEGQVLYLPATSYPSGRMYRIIPGDATFPLMEGRLASREEYMLGEQRSLERPSGLQRIYHLVSPLMSGSLLKRRSRETGLWTRDEDGRLVRDDSPVHGNRQGSHMTGDNVILERGTDGHEEGGMSTLMADVSGRAPAEKPINTSRRYSDP